MTKLEETDKEISRLKNANRGVGTKSDIFNTYMLMDIARSLAKIADNTMVNKQNPETVTEFADRCRECGAKYGRLLKEAENKSNTSELKPCPFCGTEVKMLREPLWNGSHGYYGCFKFGVKCPKCGCTVDYIDSDTIYRSEEEAIANVVKAWNERKEF